MGELAATSAAIAALLTAIGGLLVNWYATRKTRAELIKLAGGPGDVQRVMIENVKALAEASTVDIERTRQEVNRMRVERDLLETQVLALRLYIRGLALIMIDAGLSVPPMPVARDQVQGPATT